MPLFLRLVIHAAIATYLVGAIMWTLPEGIPLKPRVEKFVSPVFRSLGLWQSWEMFAPSPRKEDIYVDTIITFPDGHRDTRNLARMWTMGYFERYRKERHRKFFNDHIRSDNQSQNWPQLATWLAKDTTESTGIRPTKIELYRHWRATEPGLLARTPIDVGWNQFKFFSYDVPKENNP